MTPETHTSAPQPQEVTMSPTVYNLVSGQIKGMAKVSPEQIYALTQSDAVTEYSHTYDLPPLGEIEARAILESLQESGDISRTAGSDGSFTVNHPSAEAEQAQHRQITEGHFVATRQAAASIRYETAHDVGVGVTAVSGLIKAVSGHNRRKRKAAEAARKPHETAFASWKQGRQTVLRLQSSIAERTTATLAARQQQSYLTTSAYPRITELYPDLFPQQASSEERTAELNRRNALRAKKQAADERELDQRQKILDLRDEALANGDFDTLAKLEAVLAASRNRSGGASEAEQRYQQQLERYHRNLAFIQKYAENPEYADLFADENALRGLYDGIQAEAWPQYIEKLNRNRPADNQLTDAIVQAMSKEDRDKLLRDLDSQDKRDIVRPIDKAHSQKFAGSKYKDTDPDLLEALRLANMKAAGKIREPRKPSRT